MRGFFSKLATGAVALLLLGMTLEGAPPGKPFPFPEALTQAATWTTPEFLAAWSRAPDSAGGVCRSYRGAGPIFGHQPQAVTGWFENGRLTSITILFLDSGAWFGYVPDAQVRAVEKTRGPLFATLYRQVADDVARGLAGLSLIHI